MVSQPEDIEREAIGAPSAERNSVFVLADTTNEPEEGLDIFEMVAEIWQARWIVVGIAAVFVAAAVAYALMAKEWYQAEVLLVPVSTKGNQGLSEQLGQLGGLVGLAGINLGSTSNIAEPLAVLRSREFASEFIEEQNLLPVLFKDKWVPFPERSQSVYRSKGIDIRDGVRYFDRHIRAVRDDKKTGLVTLTITWTDPELAAKWANLLVERVNEKMRTQALDEAEANVSYLRGELAAASIVPLQQSVGRLLENELQRLMLARGSKEFSYRIVDRAATPKWRSSPKRTQLVLVGGFIGFMVAMLVAFLRLSVRRYHARQGLHNGKHS